MWTIEPGIARGRFHGKRHISLTLSDMSNACVVLCKGSTIYGTCAVNLDTNRFIELFY